MLDSINDINDIKKLNINELLYLASEIRELLINTISKNGGHLASNLGVVELTLALLKVYDFDKDKIIFDVGHQSYVYKILTGRKNKFDTLRKYKGISGFPKRAESKYDFFDTGHSSTSISASLGMARSRDLNKDKYEIVSVIGDGALTGGMVYEALNDIGFKKTKMLIILNDNTMSISLNVGGISTYLNKFRINPSYNKLKQKMHYKLDKNNRLVRDLHRLKNSIKSLFFTPMFFEDLGLKYVGPVDGHNLNELIKTLKKVKNINEPVVLHVVTHKGEGYTFAEENPNKFHAVGPFEIETGKTKESKSYSYEAGKALCEIASKDKRLAVITAAMTEGLGLTEFSQKYKDRFFDVGIAEEHAVTFSAGLATTNLRPVFCVYSTFMQRAFDQILHDVCIQNLPVIFLIDRAGLVGNDGETHQGVFDLSYLNIIPNIVILTPKCKEEIKPLIEYALTLNKPVAIRYPKSENENNLKPLEKIKHNSFEVVSKGEKLAIIAAGKMVNDISIAKKLSGCNPMIINATFVKPVDTKMLKKLKDENYKIMTIEDNNIIGGFGNNVLLELNKLGYKDNIEILGYEDKFISHGSINELLKDEKLDIDNLVLKIKSYYGGDNNG